MIADVPNPAVLQEHDQVGMPDGRQAVCDDDHQPILGPALQPAHQFVLRLGIERGRGFVQDQDAGIPNQPAGDAQALLLADGERIPRLAEHGVDALRQIADEVHAGGPRQGAHDVVVARIRLGQQQVVADRRRQ